MFWRKPPLPVLTTKHCLYIARTIENVLRRPLHIMTEPPAAGFAPTPHVVICPQIFDSFPDDFIAFQMEQTIHPRWFEPPLFAKLQKARTIVDFSRRNIEFLLERGIDRSRLYHRPVGYIENFHKDLSRAPRHEVLFYGDANNPRRRGFLDALNQDFRVTELAKVFDLDLYREMAGAKLVVNIHYYEGALLESTRIMECLSMGCLVVSEESADTEEYPHLRGLVDFVPQGNVAAMRDRVDYWLAHPDERMRRIARAHEELRRTKKDFQRMVRKIIEA